MDRSLSGAEAAMNEVIILFCVILGMLLTGSIAGSSVHVTTSGSLPAKTLRRKISERAGPSAPATFADSPLA